MPPALLIRIFSILFWDIIAVIVVVTRFFIIVV